jgi:DNA-directed RNA polymerase specialized sigma24 family protein
MVEPGPDSHETRALLERIQAGDDRAFDALGRLSETDREILLMRNIEELPYEEIGCLLDLSAAAARKRYGRALLRWQKILFEEGLLESSR